MHKDGLWQETLMGKPGVSIEDCCRQFYDAIFRPKQFTGQGSWSAFLDTSLKSMTAIDFSFLSAKASIFHRKMTGLRMELFGLSWS